MWRAVEEFPRSLREFEQQFATEEACREYLFRLRWPDGFRCPRCSGGRYWPVRSVLLECCKCGHQITVTAGTIFQDTRKPLTGWFRAMYWVTTQKSGASTLGLQRVLELKSYKTAWEPGAGPGQLDNSGPILGLDGDLDGDLGRVLSSITS